jgi:hypothetical protein
MLTEPLRKRGCRRAMIKIASTRDRSVRARLQSCLRVSSPCHPDRTASDPEFAEGGVSGSGRTYVFAHLNLSRHGVEQAFYACGRRHKTSGFSHCGNTVQVRRAKALRASVSRRPCTIIKETPGETPGVEGCSLHSEAIRQALVRNITVPPGTVDSSPVRFRGELAR